ncbi:65-kDa microtubule-associated protein 5 [Beta vulgaris subsp. vulgaris]|uniref:65-kDa microtubule-associated protein 5 n=1 Tax=Beta vulgaris subsp. vulgaris TaxID=3555 RepID=UPI002036FC9A|nr:65-kDa microtubule-associated protein 5 [Beta vulgaris subsp. vulgaris]
MREASTPSLSPTTCGSLLQELQKIWDEIGESDSERDTMLLDLEQECLDIYRRKVENTRKYKADLYQALAEGEAEIAQLNSTLGERTSFARAKGTLREQLSSIKPVLDNLRSKKQQRVKEFSEIESKIIRICAEVAGNDQFINNAEPQVDEKDLTVQRLAERKSHLEELQNEKALRLQKVNAHISNIHELSVVMSVDFTTTVAEVHPSLLDHENGQLKSISNDTLAKLTSVVKSLKQEKQQRLQKIQDLGSALMELWSLLDIPTSEQKKFEHITCLISSCIDEVSRLGSLSMDAIEQAELEVEQLNIHKASRMRELVLKRQTELEEIYREVHMEVDTDAARKMLINLIDSGKVDLSEMLFRMDDQIRQAKEEAQSRKDILDRVEKWKHAAEEENWLDEYEKDDNRYCAGRGVHKSLKRAEKARTLVSKLPSLVESLIAKVKAWEIEKGMTFLYGKEPLLHELQEYTSQRQHREEEKRRTREQKKLQEQLATEKEAIYGSKPKKPLGQSTNNNTMVGTPARRIGTPSGRMGISGSKDRRDSTRVIPVNFVALAKDDPVYRGS